MSELRYLMFGAWKRRARPDITPDGLPVGSGGFGKSAFGQSTFGG